MTGKGDAMSTDHKDDARKLGETLGEGLADAILSVVKSYAARLGRQRDEARARVAELEAERRVLLNGAAMVARYALPYFEKLDKKRPSHDTAELVSNANDMIELMDRDETEGLVVKWMADLRARAEAAEARAALLEQALRSILAWDGWLLTEPDVLAHARAVLADAPARQEPPQ